MAKGKKTQVVITALDAKLNRKIVADAISSGMYKKCQGDMNEGMDGNQKMMCIWGVITDVYNREHGKPNKAVYGITPTAAVRKWVGCDDDQMDQLMTKNDETRTTLKTLGKELCGMPVIVKGDVGGSV